MWFAEREKGFAFGLTDGTLVLVKPSISEPRRKVKSARARGEWGNETGPSIRDSPLTIRLSHLRQRRLRLALDPLEMRLVAEAFGIELVDVLGARGPCGEPAMVGLDLDAAERLAVARRLGVDRAHGIAGELGQAELLRCQRVQ